MKNQLSGDFQGKLAKVNLDHVAHETVTKNMTICRQHFEVIFILYGFLF